jgi:hypothetical protein
MVMNYESAPVDMGTQAMHVAEAAERFVAQLWGVGSATAAWHSIGLTPMIGVNDVAPQRFLADDAAQLVQFARTRGLARLSFWSANRDRPCPPGAAAGVSDSCSGVAQRLGEFTAIFARY